LGFIGLEVELRLRFRVRLSLAYFGELCDDNAHSNKACIIGHKLECAGGKHSTCRLKPPVIP